MSRPVVYGIMGVLAVAGWVEYLYVPQGLNAFVLTVLTIGLAVAVWMTWTAVQVVRNPEIPTVYTGLSIVIIGSLVINMFALFYWTAGSMANFTQQFTRLDAVYFTVGTLSTAGTGNIAATSELARGVQTAQMVLDMVLLVVAAGLLVTRLALVQRDELAQPPVVVAANADTVPPDRPASRVGAATEPAASRTDSASAAGGTAVTAVDDRRNAGSETRLSRSAQPDHGAQDGRDRREAERGKQ